MYIKCTCTWVYMYIDIYCICVYNNYVYAYLPLEYIALVCGDCTWQCLHQRGGVCPQ